MFDPATRSFTVLETRTWLGAAVATTRAATWTGDTVHVICGYFYLADMESGTGVDTDRRNAFNDRECTTYRPGRAVKCREESIAQRLDLMAAVSSDLGSNDLIVSGQKFVPCTVAEFARASR